MSTDTVDEERVTAAHVRVAREHVARYGLCKSGYYGNESGPCCTIGAVALAWALTDRDYGGLHLDESILSDVVNTLDIELDVAGGWLEWRGTVGDFARTASQLAEWNDDEASPEDVLAFYDWWAARLDRPTQESPT